MERGKGKRTKNDGDDKGRGRRDRTKKKNLGIKEWTEEDDDEIGNMVDPYNKL